MRKLTMDEIERQVYLLEMKINEIQKKQDEQILRKQFIWQKFIDNLIKLAFAVSAGFFGGKLL